MVNVMLSEGDAQFLRVQLERCRGTLEQELIHTDARAMQRQLAEELHRLEDLLEVLSLAKYEPN